MNEKRLIMIKQCWCLFGALEGSLYGSGSLSVWELVGRVSLTKHFYMSPIYTPFIYSSSFCNVRF